MAVNMCPKCNAPNRSSARFCSNCGAPLLSGVEQLSDAQVDMTAMRSGTVLQNRYRIEQELGRGGFGAVYRAWDINLKKPCAVKENLDTSPEAQRQFEREAIVLANLSHPNLPRVTDHFVIEDQGHYLVMDFVEGEDLESHLERRGRVPVPQALLWTSQVADALIYLHSRKPPVVHRDIKPANIRITPEGHAMLVDFGLVKIYDPNMQTTLGARAVTPGYAPPEQYGKGTTDPRTDIYALGATLYKLLTGQDPLESVRRMVGKHMTPANQIDRNIPAYVNQAIERAMMLEPNQRFQSAAEFKEALKEPAPRVDATMVVRPVPETQVRPASPAPTPASMHVPSIPVAVPPMKPKTRNRSVLWLGIGAVVILFLGAVVVLGIWAMGTQNESAKKTANANYQATLDERVRTTSTAIAGATKTAQANPAVEGVPTASPQGGVFSSSVRVLYSTTPAGDQQAKSELYILEPDGGQTRLTEDSSSEIGRGVSPDGKEIAFASDRSGNWQLYVLDLAAGATRQLTDLPDQARYPAWSPDGTRIAFNSFPDSGNSAIWVIEADGSGLTKVVDIGRNGRPSWSPDSKRLVFNGIHQDTNENGELDAGDHWDLFVINADGSQEANLTSTPEYDEVVSAWSPDGDWIVFVSMRADSNGDGQVNGNDNGDLYLIHPDGSGLKALTETPELNEGEPSWTLDGRQILYVIFNADSSAVWTMNMDGSNQKLLLDGQGFVRDPVELP
jgi:serine/threonine protein kinase/Tol biopolymer transport system component